VGLIGKSVAQAEIDAAASPARVPSRGVTIFSIYDASDYKLAEDSQFSNIAAHATEKVRGLMKLTYEKARKLDRADGQFKPF